MQLSIAIASPIRLWSRLRKSFNVPKTVYAWNTESTDSEGWGLIVLRFVALRQTVHLAHGAHRSFILLGGPKRDVERSTQAEKNFLSVTLCFGQIWLMYVKRCIANTEHVQNLPNLGPSPKGRETDRPSKTTNPQDFLSYEFLSPYIKRCYGTERQTDRQTDKIKNMTTFYVNFFIKDHDDDDVDDCDDDTNY